MTLNKKKCEKALNRLVKDANYCNEDKVEIDILKRLINEHFDSIEHIEGQIEHLETLINEHFELKEEIECLHKNEEILHDMINKEYQIGNFLYGLLEDKGYTKKELNELIHNYQLNNMDYSEVLKVKGISVTHDGRVGNCPKCGKLLREEDNIIQCDKCGQPITW